MIKQQKQQSKGFELSAIILVCEYLAKLLGTHLVAWLTIVLFLQPFSYFYMK